MALALASVVRETRPDVIHAHSSKAGAVARIARSLSPHLPLIYTPHGYAFAGHFSSATQRRAYRVVERALAPLASRVVCVCEAEASLARSIGPSNRVRVVHNGIGPAGDGPTDPRVAELGGRGPVLGALTLLRPGKGMETLIDALPRVLAGHPDAQLAILGEGEELEALRRRAQLGGVANAVHFLGPRADPLAALRGMDVFVHPSWAEAFPYVILEAMSLGTAIVASDVGGIREALQDGESGLLVTPRDSAALANALLSMLDDPGRRARMGAIALGSVRQRFTDEAMIDRLVDVYDELMPSTARTLQVADHQSELPAPPAPGQMTGHFTR
jgi:glycosyltransferase involved in cell wall biosynthesis